MLALLSPIFGILGSLLPSVVRIFERKQEIKYEIELTKIKLDAAERQIDLQLDLEDIKASAVERQSIYAHDSALDGGKFINALRASIRPVITYIFFFVFLAVKVSAAYVMLSSGQSVPEMLTAVWDAETMALFSTIIAFWFGSRMIEKQNAIVAESPTYRVTVSTNTQKKTK
jgi:hypothetical protein